MPRVILTTTEMNRLAAAFDAALVDFEGLETLLRIVGKKLDNMGIGKARLDDAIRIVLDRAQIHGWLEELLKSVLDHPEHGPELVAECREALAVLAKRWKELAPYVPNDPKSALFMENGEPFVDRDLLRQKFNDFATAMHPCRVFIVHGHQASGKSHLGQYFTHLASTASGDHYAYLDLGKMKLVRIGPRDLIEALALMMSLDTSLLSTDVFAQEARIAEKICHWFIGQTQRFQRDGMRWWIVIDGLDSPRLTTGAIELVLKLAGAIASREAHRCYLLLLGLDEPVPFEIDGKVVDEELIGITDADIRTYIRCLADISGRPIDPEALQFATSYALSGHQCPFGHAEMRDIKKKLRILRASFQTLS